MQAHINIEEEISVQQPPISREELEYIAFNGQFELAHAIFQRISPDDRMRFANKYVLSQVIVGGIEKMRKLLSVQAEELATREKLFVDHVLDLFIHQSKETETFPKELYESILYWSDELIKLSLPEEALRYMSTAVQMGINKFPELQLHLLSRMAHVYSMKGNLTRAYSILSDIVAKPYMLSDRNRIPEILFNLSQVAVHLGEVEYYKKLLFLGLHLFYTDLSAREKFFRQLRYTFRRSYKVLFGKGVPLKDRFNFGIHWLYFKQPDFGRIRLPVLHKITRKVMLGYLYLLNYIRPESRTDSESDAPTLRLPAFPTHNMENPPRRKSKFSLRRHNILITRAMGGIGDLLMMTPAIHALKKRYPDEEIHLAIPKRYFAVLENNPDVVLLDIEKEAIDFACYRKWFNFTDCPAARVEAMTAPRVRKGRMDIFANALRSSELRLLMINRRIRYFLTADEKKFRQHFYHTHSLNRKTVIGVQLRADETYRDYPHMESLVKTLSQQFTVLLFDARPIDGFDFPKVLKIDSYNLRQAFAIASGCDAIIAPDSSFVHFAAAMEIPCVAIFGPIDGKVRTRHYPNCHYVDARQRLGCVACWRNERIPCKLTGMRNSVCMGDISISEIMEALQKVMNREKNFATNGVMNDTRRNGKTKDEDER